MAVESMRLPRGSKRKQQHRDELLASKKAHVDEPLPFSYSSLSVSAIRSLERAALAGRAGLNGVVTLVQLVEGGREDAESGELAAVVAAFQSLHRIFSQLIEGHEMDIDVPAASSSSASLAAQLQDWLRALLSRFLDSAVRFLCHAHPSLHLSALHSLMALVQLQCAGSGDNAASLLVSGLFASTISALLVSPLYAVVHDALLSQYLLPYADLQLYALRIVQRAVSPSSAAPSPAAALSGNALTLLLALSAPEYAPAQASYVLPTIKSAAALAKALSDAWMKLLALRLPVPQYKEALVHMDSHIIPRVASPLLLADFLTDSFSIGGLSSLLSLSSLFLLMNRHNLSYPRFYQRVYSLCTPAVTASRHRQRFLHLLSVFLSSAYLPQSYVAAFAKRLSRVALLGGVDSGVVLLCVVYNLLRRNKNARRLLGTQEEAREERTKKMDSLTDFLLQRQKELAEQETAEQQSAAGKGAAAGAPAEDGDSDDFDDEQKRPSHPPAAPSDALTSTPSCTAGIPLPPSDPSSAFPSDPFDFLTDDLEHTHAEQSVLWELRSLTFHYDPTLSSLASIFFADNAPKQDLSVSDYEGLSYDALKRKEMERRKNQRVPVAFTRKSSLFGDHDVFKLNCRIGEGGGSRA